MALPLRVLSMSSYSSKEYKVSISQIHIHILYHKCLKKHSYPHSHVSIKRLLNIQQLY